MLEVLRHQVYHSALFLSEIVAALFEGVLPILPGCAADDDQSRFGAFRCGLYGFLVKLHLRVAERPVTPPAVIGGVFFCPGGVTPGKDGIVFLPCVF